MVAQARSPQSEEPGQVAEVEANKATVRRFYEQVVNGGDLRAVGDLIHPSFGDPETIAQRVQVWRAALPDGRRTIEDLVAEGDRVVVRYTDRGTHRGPFFGVPATGRAVEYGGTWVLRMAEGKIAEGWHAMDTLGLLQQLGATIALPKTACQRLRAAAVHSARMRRRGVDEPLHRQQNQAGLWPWAVWVRSSAWRASFTADTRHGDTW